MVDLHRQVDVKPVPHGVGRNDVEHRKALDALGIVERHAVGDPAAPVMADQIEQGEPQLLHDMDHVLAHGAL